MFAGDRRVHGRGQRDVPARAGLPHARRGQRAARRRPQGPDPRRPARRHRVPAVDAALRRLLRRQLDGALRPPAHPRVRHHPRAARLASRSTPAATPPATRRPSTATPDHRRLPGRQDGHHPLCLFDCDVPVDGSTAVVVSTADYAPDMPTRPIRFEAVGTALNGRASWDQWEDMTTMGATTPARTCGPAPTSNRPMWTSAEVYDGFSILTLFWLEALGFCGKGRAARSSRAASASRSTACCRSPPAAASSPPAGCTAFGHLTRRASAPRPAGERQVAGAEVARRLGRRRPARLRAAAADGRMKSRQVQLVEYPGGPVEPRALPRGGGRPPRAGARARSSSATRSPRWTPACGCGCARAAPRGTSTPSRSTRRWTRS